MRYLFSKSKYILILSFFTAFFVTIAFSNIVRAFHLTGQMQDLLSTDYYALSVNNVAKPADIIQIAEQYRGSGVLVLRYKENGTCGVYAAGRDFTPQITSGRKFAEILAKVPTLTTEPSRLFMEELNLHFLKTVYR